MRTNLNVLAFSPYPPEQGGGTKATFEIFKRLNKNIQIDLVTYQKESIKLYNIRVIHCNISEKISILRGMKYIFIGLIKSLILCKKNRYDLIYVKNLTSPGIIGYFVSWMFRIPLIVHTSGSDLKDLEYVSKNYGKFEYIYKKIVSFFIKRELKTADNIIANSLQDKEFVKEISNKDAIVIYNGVDYNKFKPFSKKANKKITCIYVGRFAKEKNLEVIIDASKNLSKIKFLIVGPTLKEIKSLGEISKNVIVLGTRKDVFNLLKKSDIFLLPSFQEGTSNALLEAMSSGLPVIAYPAGESKYLIKNGENGFIVDNKKDFIARIDYLSNYKRLMKLMGENNRELIIKKFYWDKTAKEIEKIFYGVRK